MKKHLLILTLIVSLSLDLEGQNFGGGLSLGLSTSQVSGDNLGGFNKAGLLVGVFANKSLSNLLSFQMEMTYIQKGSNNPKMSDANHKDYQKEDISSSYFEIPILLQYNQNNDLKIEAGLFWSYLIDGNYNDLTGIIEKTNNPFSKYEIGGLLGLDYAYSENISLNTRISNSILPIGSEDWEDNNDTYNSSKKGKYNSVLSFALHYNL